YEVMARYAREMRAAMRAEWASLRAQVGDESLLKLARRWLHRDTDHVPTPVRERLQQVLHAAPTLATMHAMREELRRLWSDSTLTREQMARELQAWIQRAEASGIQALRDFAQRLRAARINTASPA
ncbi:transposase, partial [Cutibacterium acnes]